MKRIYLIIMAIFTFTSFTQAQDIRFGVKGGLNVSDMNGNINLAILNLDLNGETLLNYHVGAMVHIPVSEKFAIQPELIYSAQGAQFQENDILNAVNDLIGNVNINSFEFQLGYINIPVWAKYYVVDEFALMVAPQLGIKVNDNEEIDVSGFTSDLNLIDSYNNVDFGFNFGAQYESPIGLTVGANYYLGLSEVIDTGILPINDLNHQVFMVSVGWFLN